MKRILHKFFLLLFMITRLFAAVPDELVHLQKYEVFSGKEDGKTYIALHFAIKQGWHINSHDPLDDYSIPASISLNENPYFSVETVQYPEPHLIDLESMGGKSSVFDGTVMIGLHLKQKQPVPTGTTLSGTLTYQGCDNEVCLIPMETAFSVPVETNSPETAIPVEIGKPRQSQSIEKTPVKDFEPVQNSEGQASDTESILKTGDFQALGEENPLAARNFFWVLILVFLGGLALNLTPCVYPLIPVTISYFGSQKAKGNVLILALLYVLGMAVTYSVLGTVAALSGSLFGSLMTNPVVLILLALLMLALSLSMFGLYEFRLPYALTQLGGGSRTGYVGSLMMGLTMGIVAAPCIGPFVISLLTYVAASGSALTGFLLFFTMSLGLGIPYIFLAMFSAKLDALPRSGEWLNGVRIFFGLVLVGMAIWFIHPLLNPPFSKILMPGYLILAGFYYAVFNRAGESSAGFRKIKWVLSMFAVIAGTWMMKPEADTQTLLDWQPYSTAVLQQADQEDRYVMIDFYSNSCVPCKELDAITFRDPEVVDMLKSFTVIKVDLTRGGEDLIEMYDIKGFPTVVFLDPDRREIRNARLLGFEKPRDFLNRLKHLKNKE
ncbi:MAG: thioredoxin:protein disulfide reductase [Candidatus Marinimicrobia bacterium]|jgi:thiol:disulfide interchange protein DsbD|nr:thioredoxin:protein disulfide reductase [Candidatus Neomarinimicrobiota bacterium]